MKNLFLLLAMLLQFSCSEAEKTTCDNYCDMKVIAAATDAENKLCEVHENELALYEAKCINICTEVLEYVVDPAEQKDAKTCLKCIYENTTEPSFNNIQEAREACYIPCNNLGGYQFFFSFFISDPVWDCR